MYVCVYAGRNLKVEARPLPQFKTAANIRLSHWNTLELSGHVRPVLGGE